MLGLPSRFNVIRVLRENRKTKTVIAVDRVATETRVLIKIFRKEHFSWDRSEVDGILSTYMGLRHSQILPILEAGFTKSRDFYVIRDYVSEHKSPKPRDIQNLSPLLSVVQFLNSAGYVHGAIKESNVFFCDNHVRLSDPRVCGVTFELDSPEEVRFAAPEVLQGQKPNLESDLYSLGAVIYRFIAGNDLFRDPEANLLKLKYLWAFPRIIDDNEVLQDISGAVIGLLHKDPRRRVIAFAALVRELQIPTVKADRAAFVSRTQALEAIRTTSVEARKGTLRAMVIEGPPGIGKSRLIEELESTSALDLLYIVACNCNSDDLSIQSIISAINRLIAMSNNSASPLNGKLRAVSVTLSRYFGGTGTELFPANYPIERTISDLVGVLAALARLKPIVFVVGNIENANPAIVKFVEHLCLRAAEVPLTFIATCRRFCPTSKLGTLLAEVLANDFQHVRLTPLTSDEICTLSKSLGCANLDKEQLIRASGGNPGFLERYVSGAPRTLLPFTREVVAWFLNNFDKDDIAVTETLTLFTEPTTLETVAAICNQPLDSVRQSIRSLEDIGFLEILENRIRLISGIRDCVFELIHTYRRSGLARRAFEMLRSTEQSLEELARWSYLAGLFSESATLCLSIAARAMQDQNYAKAAYHYEHAQRSSRHCSIPLNPAERINLAKCYKVVGKVDKARRMYRELLEDDSVREDPELLSLTYVSLSYLPNRSENRIRFLRLAIDSLPKDSPKRYLRHLQLCHALLNSGKVHDIGDVFEKAEESKANAEIADADISALKAAVLLNQGEFRIAIKCLREIKVEAWERLAVLNGVGLCHEHLGDLGEAKRIFEKLRQQALENGLARGQIYALSNVGCIRTKLGDTSEAKVVIEHALRGAENPRLRPDRFAVVYADAVTHYMRVANYKDAMTYCRRLSSAVGDHYPLDRFFIEIVKSEFYARLGQRAKSERYLRALKSNSDFNASFYQIETCLIEAIISRETPQKVMETLNSALQMSEQIGSLYQYCALLIEFARFALISNDRKDASKVANRALALARKRHYRLLGARAMLYAGMASEVDAQKQRYLYGAFQEASEMGLRELVAESAFEIGSFQLSRKNWVTAQEYLMRSISVLEEIAEGIPEKYRAGYLSGRPHRKALQALKACNPEVQKLLAIRSSGPDFGSEKRYFGALYQLTASGGSAPTGEGVVTSIANALEGVLSRATVVTVKHGNRHISRAFKTKHAEELISRAEKLIGKTKDRIYLAAADAAPHRPVAWVPFECPGWEGGVYVVCGPHESTFTEKEIEFLTMVGAVGSSSFSALESRNQDAVHKPAAEFHGMIGSSKAINEIFSQIQVAAANTATVLIEGESGTGKELVAKAIHAESARAKGPFIAVDCGAIPESLIEADLFGAKKGSYTGAVSDRPGLFEAAHGGTIFLDEISNTPFALQAKLLRVIQEREVRRIGETKGRSVDVRLVVASNQSLESMAEGGQFRKDLLYRLKVLHIKVPPLRARRDDIPLLARAFLQKLNITNKTKKYLDPEVMNRLSTYNFPGNVRELQNAIERAFFSTKGNAVRNVSLESETPQEAGGSEEVKAWFKDLSEGRKDFWNAVHHRYKRRDISREKVLALIDFGLRSTRGNYKAMAGLLRLKNKEYRRFMDFLRRSDCLLDFRPYRKLAAEGES